MKIALAGNPNSGKTTLFNALTGKNQFIGNWPGVTVEKKEGKLLNNPNVIITDLPGIYSLSAYTTEEVVARNYLINEKPNVILNIVDGTNLERNLYLTTQLMELNIPVVVAINMMDVLLKKGDVINIEELSEKLGCKIVTISALKLTGINNAVNTAINIAKNFSAKYIKFSQEVEYTLNYIETAALKNKLNLQRFYSIKIFENDKQIINKLNINKDTLKQIDQKIKFTEKMYNDEAESIIANQRYNYITNIVKSCVKNKNPKKSSATENIDKIVTNRFLAIPIFLGVMFLMYFVSITVVGGYVSNFVNNGILGDGFYIFGKYIYGLTKATTVFLNYIGCAEWLKSLVIDGIIAGVGSVLSFVPQIITLFSFLAFLEASGYMSRVAFILDKIFKKIGLSGKSFIPILLGTGCGVTGIMASRTIEDISNRRVTIITTTFIPCTAKLPVIALISAYMFNGRWWVAISAYIVGILAIILSGIIFKKSKIFKSNGSSFVMELPNYHLPTIKNIWQVVKVRVWSFIKKAGTIIFAASIVVWLGSRFGVIDGKFTFNLNMPLQQSVLGYLGLLLSALFVPLGFGNINASIASIMGLIAKEEIVGVFGVLNFGGISFLGAYSFLIFNLLCAPCVAAMAAIKREMNSLKWTIFAISYQCLFAYIVSFLVFQIGSFVTGSTNYFGFAAAFTILCMLVFWLLKKPAKS